MHFLNIPTIYRVGTRWIASVPKPLAYTAAKIIAYLSFFIYRQAVRNVSGNLIRVFPVASGRKISRMALTLFINYSKYLVDYGRFTALERQHIIGQIMLFDGKKNLTDALSAEKGLILLTAHLGNWELGGIFFGNYGLKTNVITLPDTNVEIDEVRRSYREKHNVKTITIGHSPFSAVEMMKALDSREVLAMLIDRYHEGLDCIEATFFGQNTKFPKGPFTLSRLTGAPIVVGFVVSDGNTYKGIVEKPIYVKCEADEADALKRVVEILERYIIMYPDQWYNFTPL